MIYERINERIKKLVKELNVFFRVQSWLEYHYESTIDPNQKMNKALMVILLWENGRFGDQPHQFMNLLGKDVKIISKSKDVDSVVLLLIGLLFIMRLFTSDY